VKILFLSLLVFVSTLVVASTSVSVARAQTQSFEQTVEFENVSPQRLYKIYMSSDEHSKFTGLPANIDPRVGGIFQAFYGALKPGEWGVTGQFKKLIPGSLIIQSWRGAHDLPTDATSTLILVFSKTSNGASISVFHYDIPSRLRDAVAHDWDTRYWSPLKEYVKHLGTDDRE
jgi:hypothetical protein